MIISLTEIIDSKKFEEKLSRKWKITKFSKESAGHFDLDAELKIWVGSDPTPISKDFKAGDNINDVYRIISQYSL